MPIFEYQCKKCGSIFEVLEKNSDEPRTIHDGCGGPVERLLSPPALQFKGTGWYITDYARNSGSKSSSSKAEPAKTESKTDSKSETSPSSKPAGANSKA